MPLSCQQGQDIIINNEKMEGADMVYEAMEFINLIKQGKLESDINSHKNSRKVVEIMENLANKN